MTCHGFLPDNQIMGLNFLLPGGAEQVWLPTFLQSTRWQQANVSAPLHFHGHLFWFLKPRWWSSWINSVFTLLTPPFSCWENNCRWDPDREPPQWPVWWGGYTITSFLQQQPDSSCLTPKILSLSPAPRIPDQSVFSGQISLWSSPLIHKQFFLSSIYK